MTKKKVSFSYGSSVIVLIIIYSVYVLLTFVMNKELWIYGNVTVLRLDVLFYTISVRSSTEYRICSRLSSECSRNESDDPDPEWI